MSYELHTFYGVLHVLQVLMVRRVSLILRDLGVYGFYWLNSLHQNVLI